MPTQYPNLATQFSQSIIKNGQRIEESRTVETEWEGMLVSVNGFVGCSTSSNDAQYNHVSASLATKIKSILLKMDLQLWREFRSTETTAT